MEPTVGTAILFAYSTFLFATTRPEDRPLYTTGVVAIFLLLVFFWQREHSWIGVLSADFGLFFALHAAVTAAGIIVGLGAHIAVHGKPSSK